MTFASCGNKEQTSALAASGDCVSAKSFRPIPPFVCRLLSRTQGGRGVLVHLELSQGEWMSCRGTGGLVKRQTAVHAKEGKPRRDPPLQEEHRMGIPTLNQPLRRRLTPILAR